MNTVDNAGAKGEVVTVTVGIVGAGSIGCYVGGALQMGGAEVHLLARPRMVDELKDHGLTISDFRGLHHHCPPQSLHLHTDVAAMAGLDCLIVTVKSADTDTVAAQLAPHVGADTVVISLQNGIDNAPRLSAALPQCCVLPGMIAFNVLQRGQGVFHAGTDGAIMVERSARIGHFDTLFAASATPFEWHSDMRSVQWSKLLLNLNNPINALSGLPLKEELSQRHYRRCLARLQREALAAIRQADIPLQRLTAVPPRWLPRVLDTPDWLFTKIAQPMLAMDPLARSSMWEDLERGRRTEIDWLNGEVVRLAAQQGTQASANSRVLDLVKKAEQGGRRDNSGEELWALLSD